MSAMELAQAVNLLTRESKHRVKDAEGGARFVTVQPLLVQLKLAVANTTAAGSFGSSNGPGIPLGAAALDLYHEIRDDVNEHWWRSYALHHGHGRGKVGQELRAWASVSKEGDALQECMAYCKGWVIAIGALLQPVRKLEIKGSCPSCKAERHVTRNADGERVGGPALYIAFLPTGAEAYCAVCGEDFDPQVLAILLRGA